MHPFLNPAHTQALHYIFSSISFSSILKPSSITFFPTFLRYPTSFFLFQVSLPKSGVSNHWRPWARYKQWESLQARSCPGHVATTAAAHLMAARVLVVVAATGLWGVGGRSSKPSSQPAAMASGAKSHEFCSRPCHPLASCALLLAWQAE